MKLELPVILSPPAVWIAAAVIVTPPLNVIELLAVESLMNEQWLSVSEALPLFLRS